jgi:hypothetical protein
MRMDARVVTLAPVKAVVAPAGVSSPQVFELRCADAYPRGCGATLRAGRPGDVLALALEHGALVHGFTPVWYTPGRVAVIAAAVTRGGEA